MIIDGIYDYYIFRYEIESTVFWGDVLATLSDTSKAGKLISNDEYQLLKTLLPKEATQEMVIYFNIYINIYTYILFNYTIQLMKQVEILVIQIF